MKTLTIRAVAFQEGDVWVVHGIEYDIVAEAPTPSKVPAAFMRAIVESACISKELGREPLEGIKPAPDRYRELFEEADAELRPVHEATQIPIAEMAIRLSEHA